MLGGIPPRKWEFSQEHRSFLSRSRSSPTIHLRCFFGSLCAVGYSSHFYRSLKHQVVGVHCSTAWLRHYNHKKRHRMKDLKGKICLVTGGTRGIGRAIALTLADAGADILFTYQHSKEQAEEVCKNLQGRGVRAHAYQANVASSEEVHSTVKVALAEFGPISILVNNAGISRDKSFIKMTKAMWDEVLGVNLDGLFNTTQAGLPAMIESGWGWIVKVSS